MLVAISHKIGLKVAADQRLGREHIMRTVLVTGATGFIGACMVHRLVKEKRNVHIIARKTSNKWRINSILASLVEHESDLGNREMVSTIIAEVKPDIIYHFATYGSYPFHKNVDTILDVNILGTLNLLYACSKHGFDHFICAGSSSEYGVKNRAMKETDILEPVEFYGIAKATATLLCQYFAKSKQLPISILRPFAVYGYYEEPTRLIPTVIKACLLGENPKVLSPSSVRDFIFVEDFVDVCIKMVSVRKRSYGEIFNVGYGKQSTVFDVVSKIVKLTGSNVRPLWGRAKSREIEEPRHWVSDSSKIRAFIGWKPKYSLDNGLEETVRWFKANLHLYENRAK